MRVTFISRIGIAMMALLGCAFLSCSISGEDKNLPVLPDQQGPTIADQAVATEAALRSIPVSCINTARDNYEVAYWHTSHGTHVINGVFGLEQFRAGDATLFAVSSSDTSGNLYFRDHYGDGSNFSWDDLSQTDNAGGWATWVTECRTWLEAPANADVNIFMWSWCDISGHNVTSYLSSMQTLIDEYGVGGTKIGTGRTRANPVTFVFMTGHGNPGANLEAGQPGSQAKLIVDYCVAHGYYCLDYYSIDTHALDGTYYDDAGDDSNSAKYASATGSTSGRFYTDWQSDPANAGNWYINRTAGEGEDTGAHLTQHITANRKAYAFWWILARVAGWDGE